MPHKTPGPNHQLVIAVTAAASCQTADSIGLLRAAGESNGTRDFINGMKSRKLKASLESTLFSQSSAIETMISIPHLQL